MTDEMERTDGHALYSVSLAMVAERIPAGALGLLWQLHQMYGPHVHGHGRHSQECCLGVLLARTPAAPLASHEVGTVSAIVGAGYDVCVERATDDGNELHLFLSYCGQPPTEILSFWCTPATLEDGLAKASLYAKAFPAGRTA